MASGGPSPAGGRRLPQAPPRGASSPSLPLVQRPSRPVTPGAKPLSNPKLVSPQKRRLPLPEIPTTPPANLKPPIQASPKTPTLPPRDEEMASSTETEATPQRPPRRPTAPPVPIKPAMAQSADDSLLLDDDDAQPGLASPRRPLTPTKLPVGLETSPKRPETGATPLKKPARRKLEKAPEEIITLDSMKDLRENDPGKLWNMFFKRCLGEVEVTSKQAEDKTYVGTVTKKADGEMVITFSFAPQTGKYGITRNRTLLSVSQINAICQGGLVCGSVYEVY